MTIISVWQALFIRLWTLILDILLCVVYLPLLNKINDIFQSVGCWGVLVQIWRFPGQRFFFIHAHSYFMAIDKIILKRNKGHVLTERRNTDCYMYVFVVSVTSLRNLEYWLMSTWKDWIQGKPLTLSRLYSPVSVGLDDCLHCKQRNCYASADVPFLLFNFSNSLPVLFDFAFSPISLLFAAPKWC